DAGQDLGPEGLGCRLAVAGPSDHLLQEQVALVLAQAGAAGIQVLTDAPALLLGCLMVDVLEQPKDDLRAVRLALGSQLTHDLTVASLMSPRSSASSVSRSRSWRRPRCSLDM